MTSLNYKPTVIVLVFKLRISIWKSDCSWSKLNLTLANNSFPLCSTSCMIRNSLLARYKANLTNKTWSTNNNFKTSNSLCWMMPSHLKPSCRCWNLERSLTSNSQSANPTAALKFNSCKKTWSIWNSHTLLRLTSSPKHSSFSYKSNSYNFKMIGKKPRLTKVTSWEVLWQPVNNVVSWWPRSVTT